MPCRVGITTDPEGRKKDWERVHPSLTGWEILATYDNKTKAQARENVEAVIRGCEAHPGGSGDECATWFVYYFRY